MMPLQEVQVELMEGWCGEMLDSTLSFACYFTINRTIKLNSLRLTLMSDGQCFQTTAMALFAGSSDVAPYDAKHQLATHRQTFAYITVDVQEISPTSDHGQGVIQVAKRPTLVPSRFCSWVKIPVPEDLPDTWSYENKLVHAKVTNTVIASLKYCTVHAGQEQLEKEVTRELELNLKKRVPENSLSEHGAITNSEEQTVSGWWKFRPRGLIQCILIICDKLGLLGHNLPMVVVINNESSRTIRKVSLTLYKEYTFRTYSFRRMLVTVRQEEISSISLPSLGPHSDWHNQIDSFTIPNNCLTSRSLKPCQFVDVRFFVRLDIRWRFGSMKCDLDVYLGSK